MPTTPPPCADELRKLYDAIMALMSGERATMVGFGDRQVTYTPTHLKDLQTLYRSFYRTCGADSGLPDLANATERGPPAVARFN